MLRDVNVQDAPPIMTDDEEAVEHAEGNRVGTVKKSIAAIASRWFLRKVRQRLAGSEPLGACFIQREIVRSENVEAEHEQFPMDARCSSGCVLGNHPED